MGWLSAAVLGTMAANAVLVGLYALLLSQEREDSPRYLRWWAAAWMASLVRYAATLALSLGGSATWQAVELLGALVNGWLLVVGTAELVGRRCPPTCHATFGLVGVWTLVALWVEVPFFARTAPVFFLLGAGMILAGGALWRSGEGGRFGRLAAVILVLWGLHRLDYPFLRPVVWFAPYGFALAAMLEQLTAFSTILLHVERNRRRLWASEERYRRLVEDSPVGIFRADARGRLVDASPALLRLLNVPTLEALPGTAGLETWGRLFDAVAASDGASVELDVQLAAGRVRIAAQGRELGPGVGWQGVVRDVTDAHRLAERLQASERLEAMGRLAGGVAHDFNNVLTVIQAGASAAQDSRLGDERRAQLLADVVDAAERGTAITRQLLTLSRFRGERERLDLAEEVASSRRFLTQLVGNEVSLDVQLEPVHVWAERAHVQQILINLVSNARDATPAGGRIELRVERVDEGTPLAGEPPLPWARIVVRDSGLGMDAETRERAFDAFFTTKGGGGTGLGLVTVRAAVQQADGAIRVESAPGRGTVFEVLFPVASPEPELEPSVAAPITSRRVLLAEDEDAVRRVFARVLRREGFDVTEAADGAEAVALFEAGGFDALISDVRMPKLGGVELAETLRAADPSLRVLFVSGFTETSVREIQRRVPGSRFVSKPIGPSELVDELRALLA